MTILSGPITIYHSCSAILLKGDGSGFPAKKSITLRISSFHSFWLYFRRYSPTSLMCSSRRSMRPSIQHFFGSAIDLNLCSSSTTLGKFHSSGGLRMFQPLRELSIVFMCLRVSAALLSSSFCLYLRGSMPQRMMASSMSWCTAGFMCFSSSTATSITLSLKASSQQFSHIQQRPSFSNSNQYGVFSRSSCFDSTLALGSTPKDCLVAVAFPLKVALMGSDLLLVCVAPRIFMCYSSRAFIAASLSRWCLILRMVLKAMSRGTAISMELGSCLTRYFSAKPLAFVMFSKTSAVKLIWSRNKSFPKNRSTINSQSINFSKSSTNFLLYSMGTFQKLTPVAKSAQSPCFI